MRSTDQIKRTLRGPDYVEKPIDRAVSQPIVGRVFRPAVAEGASEDAPYKSEHKRTVLARRESRARREPYVLCARGLLRDR